MRKILIDKYTKEQAVEYANTEASVRGFEIGSDRWQKAAQEYVKYAVGTMSLGRNPRSHRYKTYTTLYPEVFAQSGFAGKIASQYKRQDGGTSIPIQEVQNRILSSVMNLAKLFENGILETKNTTTGNAQGEIPNKDASELQFPKKSEFSNEEEFKQALIQVVQRWFIRDLISDCILESLSMFWRLSKKDVDDIISAMKGLETIRLESDMKQGREEFIKRLRASVKPIVEKMNYKRFILRTDE